MPSAVIFIVNQIGLSEVKSSLLKCYYCKGNHVGYGDTNILGVDEAPDIKRLDYQTDEDPPDQYDITDVDIDQDEQQYDQ